MSARAPRLEGAAPWLACRDLATTVRWYREALGFTGAWHWTWGDPPDHAGVSRGRTRILLFQDAGRAAARRGSEVVIYVRGVTALHDEYRAAGATVVRPLGERPWGTLDFTVEGPDGVRLIFTEAPDWTTDEPDDPGDRA